MCEPRALPATMYSTVCPRCGEAVEFAVFEASFYDFATYRGETTGSLYRLDRDACALLRVSLESALMPAAEREGGASLVLPVPENVRCGECGLVFQGPALDRSRRLGERQIEAVELPEGRDPTRS
jgi:hypothetical protein